MSKPIIDKSKIVITGYDDLFGGSSGGKCDADITEVSLKDLKAFKDHPFKVRDDEEMRKLAESIKEYGVLMPALVRPHPHGGYELISGHRRARAAQIAGKSFIPAIVMDVDDDTSIIAMVDSNLHREVILPSEKAFSYKMKLEAIKHQGKRTDIDEGTTSVPGEQKLFARDIVARDAGESAAQVRRYIRLTELTEDLMQMVDDGVVGLKQGVELSYLNKNEQRSVYSIIRDLSVKINLEQASRIKSLSKSGHCSRDSIYAVLHEEPIKPRKFVIKPDKLSEYFGDNVSDDVIERTIFGLLDKWKKEKG